MCFDSFFSKQSFKIYAVEYSCIRLQLVNLRWCARVSDVVITSLAYGCPNLCALDLCCCLFITVIGHSRIGHMRRRPKICNMMPKNCWVLWHGQQIELLHS